MATRPFIKTQLNQNSVYSIEFDTTVFSQMERIVQFQIVEQVTTLDQSQEAQYEDTILDKIQQLGPSTANDLTRYIKSLSTPQIGECCDRLVSVGVLEFELTRRKTRRYYLPGQQNEQ